MSHIHLSVYSACNFTKTGPNFLSFWWFQNVAVHINTYMLDDQPFLIDSTTFLSQCNLMTHNWSLSLLYCSAFSTICPIWKSHYLIFPSPEDSISKRLGGTSERDFVGLLCARLVPVLPLMVFPPSLVSVYYDVLHMDTDWQSL